MGTKRKKLVEKIISSLIIFSMIFMNGIPILSGIVYAAENPADNVEVKGYFSGESFENTNSLVCDVNDETLKINFEVSVKGEGYLKNAVLKFKNDCNFVLNPEQGTVIKDNILKLPAVSNNANLNVSIPISFEDKDEFKLVDLSRSNKVIFKGEYIDNESIIHVVEKELIFDLSWKEISEPIVKAEMIKNIDFQRDGINGKMIQMYVELSGNTQSRLPLESSEIVLDLPYDDGLELKELFVDVTKLSYTQGKGEYNTDFSKANYRIEDSKIIINVQNEGVDGEFCKSIGADSYILTFIYNGQVTSNENSSLKISANVYKYDGSGENAEFTLGYNLSESVGETVQYIRESENVPINKGYLLANGNQDRYEIAYSKKDILSISKIDLISGLEVVDVEEFFIDDDTGTTYSTENNSYYKKTEFSKENLLNILGEEGHVEILNLNGDILGNITLDMEADENGNLSIEYQEQVSNIRIKFTSPISDGNISIVSTKYMRALNYEKEEIKTFDRLISKAQAFVIYDENAINDLGIFDTSMEISKVLSNARLEMSQTEFSTTSINGNVNFQIKLNNNEDSSDLYQNPVFEIRLPSAIREVNIKTIDLFYANGELKISNVENFTDGENQIIRISLEGTQTGYNFNKETNGTVISLCLDLIVDEFTGNISENVEMCYYNQFATAYANEMEWNMLFNNELSSYGTNGYDNVIVSYKGLEGLLNAQTTETNGEISDEIEEEPIEDEDNHRVISLNQGPQSDLLEEGVSAKLATMYISIMNNTQREYSNFIILGRIPFAGNKEILTQEDLGTTVDTILDTEIISADEELPYTVYYSENPEATADINDANNGWRTDFYKMGGIKSYLIVMDPNYILEKDGQLEFSYDYVIPADLKAGDAFYGTYATYYTEVETHISNDTSADKIGYQIEEKTNIIASMELATDELEEFSKATYSLFLKNDTDVDAKGLVLTMEVPDEFFVVDDDVTLESIDADKKRIYFYIEDVEANSEKTIDISFYIYGFESDSVTVTLNPIIDGKNLENSIVLDTLEQSVKKTKVKISETHFEGLRIAGSSCVNTFSVNNVSNETFYNVSITKKFEDVLEYRNSIIDGNANYKEEKSKILNEYIVNEDGSIDEDRLLEMNEKLDELKGQNLDITESYDSNTNTVTWTIKEFKPGDSLEINYEVYIKKQNVESSENMTPIITTCNLNDGDKALEIHQNYYYNQSQVDVNISNVSEVGYAEKGDTVVYSWDIKNNNNYDVTNAILIPTISEGAKIVGIRLETSRAYKEYHSDSSKKIYAVLPANSVSKLIITVKLEENIEVGTIETFIDMVYDDVYEQSVKTITELENVEKNGRQISGTAYIDKNLNQRKDGGEDALSGIIVNLYNSETNQLEDTQITDVSGRYNFKNLVNGMYYVKFNYDDTKYVISSNEDENINQDESNVLDINDDIVTDNIKIIENSVSNIDIGLEDENIFDMTLSASVNKITIQNSAENSVYEPENKALGKVDIDPKLVSDSKVLIEYSITVKNQGTIPGKIEKIVDYTPDEIEFDSSINPNWYVESDGNIATTVLKDEILAPGETRELKLILVKKMTEENTGLIYNSFEIAKSTNDNGASDIDSIAGNKLNEDDLCEANVIIGITTGNVLGRAVIIMAILILLIPLIILIYLKIDERRYV